MTKTADREKIIAHTMTATDNARFELASRIVDVGDDMVFINQYELITADTLTKSQLEEVAVAATRHFSLPHNAHHDYVVTYSRELNGFTAVSRRFATQQAPS